MNVLHVVYALTTSLIVSAAATPAVISLANKYSLIDDKSKRSHPANTHTGIIPRAGGLAIYAGVLVGSILFIPGSKILTGILIGGALIVALGMYDDKKDLSPYIRFILNAVIVSITIMFGLGIPYISNPFGEVIRLDTISITFNFFDDHSFLLLANLFSLIWVVALMNFVNWSSGVDGQMPGFVAIAAVILGLLALRFTAHDISSESVVLLAFIVAGAYIGFLPWNFYPQKIMPGYSGGALAGFLLAVLSILSWGKIGTLVLVLAVPCADAMYTIARRIKQGQSPFKGDAGHFHHRLLRIGWGRRRIAVFYWSVSLLFGIAALYFEGIEKVFALIVVASFLCLFILLTNKLSSKSAR